ncbi:hypothetical protein [Mangrovimonas sp. DI 80]|uniref:hypothetical protein n=1 Tax=Mangrovimonas sp. DI 80 TaxID=1779330 RepID=UPI00097615AC|nr:hypothetical protein [Mangrovimonas sp. DI 80]OMP30076.1 hypothetical protein BKM32_14455 [Mangrovimonas sp. DI 80]
MDYYKIYRRFYRIGFEITKSFVMDEMKKAKIKGRPFTTAHNRICKNLRSYLETEYALNLINRFKEPYNLFQDRYTYYDGEEADVVDKILNDEILDSYHAINESGYNRFVANLALETVLRNSLIHYKSYKDYYELIYALGKYEFFFFENFENFSFRSSYFYKEMMDQLYPENKDNSIGGNNELESEVNKEIEQNELKHSQEHEETLGKLDQFNDNERFLVIHIIQKILDRDIKDTDVQFPTISATSFIKLMRIVGGFDDLKIFYQEANNNTAYSKVKKGLEYYSSDKSKQKLIDSTMSKLKDFDFGVIMDELEEIKTELLSNKNIYKR